MRNRPEGPPIICVEGEGSAWRWRMIGATGATLIERTGFDSRQSAIKAARAYRAAFFVRAAGIDHRQGACI